MDFLLPQSNQAMLYVSADTSDFIVQFVACSTYCLAKECITNGGMSLFHKAANTTVAHHFDISNFKINDHIRRL